MRDYYLARAAWEARSHREAMEITSASSGVQLMTPTGAATFADALSILSKKTAQQDALLAWIWREDPRAYWIAWLQQLDLSTLPPGGALHRALVETAERGLLSADPKDVPNGGRAALPAEEIPEMWGDFGARLAPALVEARLRAPEWDVIAADHPEGVLARFLHDFVMEAAVAIFIFRLGAIRRAHPAFVAAVCAASRSVEAQDPAGHRELLWLHAGRDDVEDPIRYLGKLRRLLGDP